MKETRLIESSFHIRSEEGDGGPIIEGWASVFNQESKLITENGKTFYEIIKPGAFDEALARTDLNVIANRDHDDYKMLARTTSGTLTLRVEDYGLKYIFESPNTPLGNETVELIKRGDLFESSFRYSVRPADIKWWRGDDGILRRDILKVFRLSDVAVVVNGAFSNTNISAESMRSLEEFEAQEELVRSQELEDYYNKLNDKFYGVE